MITCGWCITSLRPGSDRVLHSRRIYFNVLSSCKSRRLNQLETVNDFGSAQLFFTPGPAGITAVDPAFTQTPNFT